MTETAAYTQTMTYNADPENAIADLRGVACILGIMATADEVTFKNAGDAYGVLGEMTRAIADCLGKAITNAE